MGSRRKFSGQSLTNICDFFIFYHSSTREMELDYYHQKLNVRVVSRTAIRFKTYDLRKLYKNLEIELWHNLMPSLCTKIRIWQYNYKIEENQLLIHNKSPNLFDFDKFFSTYFVRDYSWISSNYGLLFFLIWKIDTPFFI